MLSTAAALLDQQARRQERRAVSARTSDRRRRIDALSAAAGAIAMVRRNLLMPLYTSETLFAAHSACRSSAGKLIASTVTGGLGCCLL